MSVRSTSGVSLHAAAGPCNGASALSPANVGSPRVAAQVCPADYFPSVDRTRCDFCELGKIRLDEVRKMLLPLAPRPSFKVA